MEGPGLVSSVMHAVGKSLAFISRGQAPEPNGHVIEFLASLKMTPRDLNDLYRTFHRLQQFQSRTVTPGPGEVSEDSLLTLIAVRRYWVKNLLANLVELGGCRDVISWDAFLYVFLRFCSLSKVELCQCLFYIISKSVKSWTVHYLTSTQLQEFYDFYANCPVMSFSTKSISFTRLPLNRYYMSDFVELVHRFGQLVNPLVHLQRSMQQNLPSISFWDDYDRIEVCNRKITLGFFLMTKKKAFLAVAVSADTENQEDLKLKAELRRQKKLQEMQQQQQNMTPGMFDPGVAGMPLMQDQLALQNATGVPSMPGPTSMGSPTAQSMPALTAGSPVNDPLRAAASNQFDSSGMAGAGTGLMGSSPSQPNMQMSQYGTNMQMSSSPSQPNMQMSQYGTNVQMSSSQSQPNMQMSQYGTNMQMSSSPSQPNMQMSQYGTNVQMSSSQSQPNMQMSQYGTNMQMSSSLSQPNMQMSQYGTNMQMSQFAQQPQRPSLPQMVLGALKSTFGVSRTATYELPDKGPYSRFNRPPPPGLLDRFKKKKKEFPAWIRQYMDMPKKPRMGQRFEEVDFIRKSRMREHHRDDIVSIIGRSTPCELLDRPGQGKSKVRGKRALDGDVQQAPGLVGGPNSQLAGRGGLPGAPAGAPGAGAAPGQPR